MAPRYDWSEQFLVGAPLEEWQARRRELRPAVNSKVSDAFSEGYELRATANITPNWRVGLNAAKTDRSGAKTLS